MERHDVRAFREKHGLSQSQLANRLNTTERTVRRWEVEKVNPSPNATKQLKRVAKEEADRKNGHTSASASPTPTHDLPSDAPRRRAPQLPTPNAKTVAHLPGDTEGARRLAPLAAVLPSMGKA